MHSFPFHSRKTVQKCQNPLRNYHPRGRSGYFYGNKGRENDFLDADDGDEGGGRECRDSVRSSASAGRLALVLLASRPIKVRQKNSLANSAESGEGIASRCTRICEEPPGLHASRCRTDGGIPSFGIILSIPGSRFICLQTVVCPSVVRPPDRARGRRSDAANKSGRMTEIAANVFPGMGMPTERGGGTRRTDGQTIPSKQKG